MAVEEDSLDISQLRVNALSSPPLPDEVASSRNHDEDSDCEQGLENLPLEIEDSAKFHDTDAITDTLLNTAHANGGYSLRRSLRTKMTSSGSQKSFSTQELSQWMVNGGKSDSTSRHSSGNVQGTAYMPDQTGYHVDLSQCQGPELATQDGELGVTPQRDVRTEMFPEERRFKQLETPIVDGKTRDPNGGPASTFATPQLPANPFAKQGAHDVGLMGLSQIFKATQAPSSPIAARFPPVPSSDLPSPGVQVNNFHNLPSDIVSDNTSPLFNSAKRPQTAPSRSSPTRKERTGLQRTVTEPHTQYITRKMSQEERQRRLRQLEVQSSPIDKDSAIIDAEFEDTRGVDRRNKRRKIEKESRAAFTRITAPPRPTVGKSLKSQVTGRDRTFRSSRTAAIDPDDIVVISDQPKNNESEDETETEDELAHSPVESENDNTEENKENRGVNLVQVPRTSLRIKRGPRSRPSELTSSPSNRRQAVLQQRDDSEDELVDTPSQRSTISPRNRRTLGHDYQLVTIVDSQSSQKLQSARRDAAKGQVVSSNDSRKVIPQSQATKIPPSSEIKSSAPRRTTADLSQQTPSPPLSSSPHRLRGGFRNSQSSMQDVAGPIVQQHVTPPGSSPPLVPRQSYDKLHSSPNQVQADQQSDKEGSPPDRFEGRRKGHKPNSALEGSSSVPSKLATQPNHEQTLASTIPETTSHPSSESRNLVTKSSTSFVTGGVTVQPAVNNSDQTNLVSRHGEATPQPPSPHNGSPVSHNLETPRGTRRSDAQRKKTPSPRKPKPFTSIAPEAPSSEETDGTDIDISGLLTVEDTEFRAQMDRMDRPEGSSPIGPARKRRRGSTGRPIVPIEPSSASRRDASPEIAPAKAQETQAKPATEHEHDELETGPRTSAVATRRLSIESIGERQQNQSNSPLLSRVEKSPQVVARVRGLRASKKGTSSRPLATTAEAVRFQSPASEQDNPEKPNLQEHRVIADKPIEVHSSDGNKLELRTNAASCRVLAIWSGSFMAFFPATCLALILEPPEPKYKVRFDDGTVTTVNRSFVKRLELRKGDSVKLYREGQRAQVYEVTESPSLICTAESSASSQYPLTDAFGNDKVKLRPKLKVESQETAAQELVPVTDIYLTKTMWTHFEGREYIHPSPSHASSGLQTPLERSSCPSTPASRMRSAKAASNLSTNQRAISASKTTSYPTSSLFANIIFAITSISEEDTRNKTQRSIISNGGTLLPSGFEDLFDLPSPTSFPPKPSKQAAKNSSEPSSSAAPSDPNSSASTFALNSWASQSRFALLLADTHCRTTKYIQALALGLPCIHTRWVTDCVRAGNLLDWRPYLLASGESAFLHGAVASRRLGFDYQRPSADGVDGGVGLANIISARQKWMQADKVLLVGGGKASGDVMAAYVFIAYALGAGKVAVVGGRKEAEEVLKGRRAGGGGGESGGNGAEWDWVCVNEEEGGGRRKRGSGRESTIVVVPDKEALEKCTSARVVGTEFVVQSLILGRLLDG